MGLREALHGPEPSPAHLSLARAQLPARAPPELSVPTSLPWAAVGLCWGMVRAQPQHPLPRAFLPVLNRENPSFLNFFSLLPSDGEKRGSPEGCTVTQGLLSSFGCTGCSLHDQGKEKMCHCCDNCGGPLGLQSSGRAVDAH